MRTKGIFGKKNFQGQYIAHSTRLDERNSMVPSMQRNTEEYASYKAKTLSRHKKSFGHNSAISKYFYLRLIPLNSARQAASNELYIGPENFFTKNALGPPYAFSWQKLAIPYQDDKISKF
jgi:hypothetical protein